MTRTALSVLTATLWALGFSQPLFYARTPQTLLAQKLPGKPLEVMIEISNAEIQPQNPLWDSQVDVHVRVKNSGKANAAALGVLVKYQGQPVGFTEIARLGVGQEMRTSVRVSLPHQTGRVCFEVALAPSPTLKTGQAQTACVNVPAAPTVRPAPRAPSVPATQPPTGATEQAGKHTATTISPGMRPVVRAKLPTGSGLTCPAVPHTAVTLPPAPYDEKRGDCALVGKSKEIETYLRALEAMAAGCNARRASAWQNVLDARARLDREIDALPAPPPEDWAHIQPVRPSSGHVEPAEYGDNVLPAGGEYTQWLKTIGENTAKYCKLIDELIKPLAEACQETREDVAWANGATDAQKASFHSRIRWAMHAATIRYDYTAFFYTNTLQQYGWGNFRQYFNESAIECGGGLRRRSP